MFPCKILFMKTKLFFSITFLLIHLSPSLQAQLCEVQKTPSQYLEVRKLVEDKISSFSNSKVIAKKADETLSKLIAAKSPMINVWMQNRGLYSKSEDEIVKEWRIYFARNFILSKYPHNEKNLDQEIVSLFETISKQIALKTFQEKLQKLFSQAQKQSLTAIQKFPLTDDQKKKISTRIESIKLYWMKDFKNSKMNKLPLEYLEWGIAYDPMANEINIGLEALTYPNDETYLAVFSHEIGHSIDSCRWSHFFEGAWPFEPIGECLRKPESVGAQKRDDSKMDLLVKANKELAESMKKNPTCNKVGYPPMNLQADQLPEAFADWFSAEVMALMPDIKVNQLRSDLCENKKLQDGSSYPTNDLRLNAIYLTQPGLRSKLPISKNKASLYCTWNSK